MSQRRWLATAVIFRPSDMSLGFADTVHLTTVCGVFAIVIITLLIIITKIFVNLLPFIQL